MKSKFWKDIITSKKQLSYPLYPFFLDGRQDVIFIHIPKTAGTSIRKSLGFNQVDKKIGFNKHKTASKVIDHLGVQKWENSFKFCFVRNPWDRLLSQYHYKLRRGKIRNEDHQKSFKKWIISLFSEIDHSYMDKKNLTNQTQWLKNQNGDIDIDFIGRYENLQSDFNTLTKMISINVDLEHINQNPIKIDYRQHYDNESQDLVRRYYQEDINYFKYQF